MKELITWLQDPVNMAILGAIFLALAGAIRGAGELFIAIGNLNKKPDKWDSLGAALLNISTKIGKLITWFGIGNRQNKSNA
ncbi:MAG: hypothetical protein PHC43_00885 [Candidatus Marinimicrobia bacterium]|jgi:hypothetical protein|nr:hypothetical protein [Candidatus Neomarinimicrobiota bacterium]MDD5229863.1 hypothetical protein [Candidatus Neomarinimicrobiota bacterium]